MKIKINGFGQSQNAILAGFVRESFLNEKKWNDESRANLLVHYGSDDKCPRFVFTEVTKDELLQTEVLRKKLRRMSGISGGTLDNFSTTYSIHSVLKKSSTAE